MRRESICYWLSSCFHKNVPLKERNSEYQVGGVKGCRGRKDDTRSSASATSLVSFCRPPCSAPNAPCWHYHCWTLCIYASRTDSQDAFTLYDVYVYAKLVYASNLVTFSETCRGLYQTSRLLQAMRTDEDPKNLRYRPIVNRSVV